MSEASSLLLSISCNIITARTRDGHSIIRRFRVAAEHGRRIVVAIPVPLVLPDEARVVDDDLPEIRAFARAIDPRDECLTVVAFRFVLDESCFSDRALPQELERQGSGNP